MNIINNNILEKIKQEGYIAIQDINKAKQEARLVLLNKKGIYFFIKPYLLSIFIEELKYLQLNVSLINCDSSENRVEMDLYNADISNYLCIYYNVKTCNNQNIIHKILSTTCVICL